MFKVERPLLQTSARSETLQLAGWEALEAEATRTFDQEDGDKATEEFLQADGVLNEAPLSKDAGDWAVFNQSMQRKLEAWTTNCDLSVLVLLRMVMSISSKVFFILLKRSSKQWDIEQEKAACNGKARKYRLAEALLGNEVDTAMEDIRAAFHAKPPCVPAVSRTRAHRVLLFTLLSRLSGALHFFIRSLREGYPYRCAGLLVEPCESMAESVLELPVCMRDKFSEELFRRFPDPAALVSQECLSVLHAAMDLCELDVAGIECRHASVRHLLDNKSSTWDVLLPTISADFLLRQSTVKNSEYVNLLQNVPMPAGIAKNRLCTPVKLSRRKKSCRVGPARSGGGQRACFREFLGQRRKRYAHAESLGASYKKLHAQYKALPADEAAHYAELGAATAISRRAGVKPLRGSLTDRQTRRSRGLSTPLSLEDEAFHVRKLAEQELQSVAQRKQEEDARATAVLAQRRQALMVSTAAGPRLGVQVPCAHFVPDLQESSCKSFQWCNPAADLAKAGCAAMQRSQIQSRVWTLESRLLSTVDCRLQSVGRHRHR